jgi:cholesterol transport system auxiliary component
MIGRPFFLRATMMVAMLSLGGCVGTLLGGGKPDQLYRFGQIVGAPGSEVINAPGRSVVMMPPRFAPEAAGDRVLTSEGNAAAYVKGMRWTAPAPVLYAAALDAAAARRAPDMAFATRGAAPPGAAMLTVEIDRFEAEYGSGSKAPPTISVQGMANLYDSQTRAAIGRYRIHVSAPAAARNAAAIAAAFDDAVQESAVGLIDWVNLSTRSPRPGSK